MNKTTLAIEIVAGVDPASISRSLLMCLQVQLMNDHHKKQTQNKTDAGFELYPISTSRAGHTLQVKDKEVVKKLNFFLPSRELLANKGEALDQLYLKSSRESVAQGVAYSH